MEIEGLTVEQLRNFLSDKDPSMRVTVGDLANKAKSLLLVSAEWQHEKNRVVLFPLSEPNHQLIYVLIGLDYTFETDTVLEVRTDRESTLKAKEDHPQYRGYALEVRELNGKRISYDIL